MSAQHTQGPWKVVPHPILGPRHPFHESRYVMTGDAQISVSNPNPDARNANDWDTAWHLDNGVIICELRDSVYHKQNARLIAAAPELLAACRSALNVGEIAFETCALSRDVGAKLRAAIAKATGGAS